MFYTEKNNIFLTKGDTAYLTVDVYHSNKRCQAIKPQAGDKLILNIKEPFTNTFVLSKTIDLGQSFAFNREDTINLEPGRYRYTIQYITMMDEIYTIIPYSYFYLEPEISTPQNTGGG